MNAHPIVGTDLYARLAEVSLDDPRLFAQSVLEILRERFDLVAGSLYISTADASSLRLRAQVGFAYRDYESFDLPHESFAGRAIALGQSVVSSDISRSPLFRNKKLLATAPIHTIVAVPLALLGESSSRAANSLRAPDPIGALCLFPREAATAGAVAGLATQLAPFVARLYLSTIERAAMSLRHNAVRHVAYRKDVGSLAHGFLELALKELSVEAAALWVLDARRNLLYRRRALRPRTPEQPGILPSLPLNDSSLIVQCFRSTKTLRHDAEHPLWREGNVDLAYVESLRNWTAVPVKLPPDAKLRGRNPSAAGVLEIANHSTAIGDTRHLTTLSWEDSYLAEFLCELLSVLVYQMLRTQDHESDFERLMHGARTSLQGARSHLQALEQLDLEEHLPQTHRHFIPNAIDWLEDLEAQINRDDIVNKGHVQLEPIPLYGGVLAKLEPMVRRMNTRNESRPLALTGIDKLAHHYREVPLVQGNRQALDCVFRNLLDNSRKYCRPVDGSRPEATILVLVEDGGKHVVLYLSDNGEGLPREEADLIFVDGFRGSLARGVQPQGVGRGLYDCRRLMEAMEGTIELVTGASGIRFRLQLRSAPTRVRR